MPRKSPQKPEDDSNSLGYETLLWILNKAADGFYLLVASPDVQRSVAERLASDEISVYDCASRGNFTCGELVSWANELPDSRVLFVINLQAVLTSDDAIFNFNMSRDLFAGVPKVWIFGVNMKTRQELAAKAFDIYSFFRINMELPGQLQNLQQMTGDTDFSAYGNEAEAVGDAAALIASYQAMEHKILNTDVDAVTVTQAISNAETLKNIARAYERAGEYDHALRLLNQANVFTAKAKLLNNEERRILENTLSLSNKSARREHNQ